MKQTDKPFLTDEEMNAIEDMMWCELAEEQQEKVRPHLHTAWEKLCDIHDRE